MEEKRRDLDVEKQKKIIFKLVEKLSLSDPDLYYRSTSEIALIVKNLIDSREHLLDIERELVSDLTSRDIELRLGIR